MDTNKESKYSKKLLPMFFGKYKRITFNVIWSILEIGLFIGATVGTNFITSKTHLHYGWIYDMIGIFAVLIVFGFGIWIHKLINKKGTEVWHCVVAIIFIGITASGTLAFQFVGLPALYSSGDGYVFRTIGYGKSLTIAIYILAELIKAVWKLVPQMKQWNKLLEIPAKPQTGATA